MLFVYSLILFINIVVYYRLLLISCIMHAVIIVCVLVYKLRLESE